MMVYTPLYIYASYLVYSFNGALFESGRLVSFASIFCIVACLYFTLHRLGVRKLQSLLFSLLFLAFPVVWRHGVTMRNDQMALALEVMTNSYR
jgi:4-amino-4-deoxy-L-arabinose transferase-like glycosyltransferase